MPDELQPRAYDSHHGRPESYWTERNALVDAVKAITPPDLTGVGEAWDRYRVALAALRAFDAANGGSPIL